MHRNRLVIYAILGVVLMWAVVLTTQGGQTSTWITDSVRGKSPALPLVDVLTPEEALAQDLALSDPRVQDLTIGRQSEVFGIKRVGMDFPEGSAACAHSDCRQVEIYLWAEDATVTAIVDVTTSQVYDVLYQPGVHPGLSFSLMQRAIEIIHNAPEVAETLGFQPPKQDILPMEGDLLNTSCDGSHICASATFRVGDRFMWATADLTENKLAGIGWSPASEQDGASMLYIPGGCPTPGSVTRNGWSFSYEITPSDGLRVYNVVFNGLQAITSIKLVEWHADYGSNGFQDSTGCGGGGGGYTIYPYGETAQVVILDDDNTVTGFEMVQDFRMSNWGNYCNYRYEQHIQFFNDGRFRVVQAAYGKGCGTNALYRSVVRINVAINDEANDNFAYWNGSDWTQLATEDYRVSYTEPGHGPHETDSNGYAWKVYDSSDIGYFIEMDTGQWDGELGRGDNPFVYATLHHPGEGDSDLGVIGLCCNNDHQQGPHSYVNSEDIVNQNLVLWYVAQGETDAETGDGNGYYCWTITGEPNPETYPCFMGPMFHPINTVPTGIVSGVVSLQGRSDFSGVAVAATDQTSNTYTAATDNAGNFSLYLPAGTYSFNLEMAGYLDAEISGVEVVTDTTNVLAPIMLLGGDTDDNDRINILDLVFIGSRYGLACLNQGWDSRADINADCMINVQDLTIASSNFNTSSPVPWE